MRRHPIIVLVLLVGCGDRSIESHDDQGVRPDLPPKVHAECKGNTGRTEKAPQCGCHCAVCDDEQCLSVLCDDSCMPRPCPSSRPEPGSSCSGSQSCEYLIEPCLCGPSDLSWRCTCANEVWSCGRGYDCYPCGKVDAGVDLRRDGAPPDLQPDQQLKADGCKIPSYPTDCSLVSSFQCGFSASCAGNTVTASWHEHVFCGGTVEQIVNYSCSYSCPGSCNAAAGSWPQNGTDLVTQYCK